MVSKLGLRSMGLSFIQFKGLSSSPNIYADWDVMFDFDSVIYLALSHLWVAEHFEISG